jgi:mitochondrial inner membrane protease subunit 2
VACQRRCPLRPSMMNAVILEVMEFAHRSIWWIPVGLCGTDYIASISRVSGRSMQPTLNSRGADSQDVILLDKWAARRRSYSRGDVVVMQSPTAPREQITKRVIGVGGDWVFRRGEKREMVHVPVGHIWVEGDNAENSNDSTSFGAVPAGLVRAQVRAKIWPPREVNVISRQEPSRQRVIRTGDNTGLRGR